MVRTGTDEGEAPPIGRERHRCDLAAHRQSAAAAPTEHSAATRPDMVALEKYQAAAVWGECRRVPATHFAGVAIHVDTTHTSRGMGPLAELVDVGATLILERLAPREGDRLRVRRPSQLADVEPVIPGESP